jgi:hypothetical protein
VEEDWKNVKYSAAARNSLQRFLDAGAAIDLPPFAHADLSAEAGRGLVYANVAKSTWQKYSSGWNAFRHFEVYHETTFAWPLSKAIWRLFVIWCLTVCRLQPSSTRSYISAIKFVHNLKDVPCFDVKNDHMITWYLRGAANLAFSNPPPPSTRRIVTLQLLRLLGHRIASTSWSVMTKQVVWAACTLAFFTAARLGELLASAAHSHDPTADLTWRDIEFTSPDSILVRLKCAKSGEVQGEYLDVFPFLGYECCPVASLYCLRELQKEAGILDPTLPVFRFDSGKNLTTSQFNGILSNLLADLCLPGEDSISCHSFRSGIPSTLALFPDLANCEDIKGWGRWHSECFNRYTRLRHDQKKAIFEKIRAALIKAHHL